MNIIYAGILIKLIVMVAFFLSPLPSFAADDDADQKHKIYLYVLKERLNAEGDLSYNQLLDFVSQDVGDSVELVPAPLRRSALNFLEDSSSCVFPSAPNALKRVHKEKLAGRPLVASAPIDYVSIRLYTREGEPVIEDKAQLKGKTVGHLLGSIGTVLIGDDEVVIQEVKDETALLKMLLAERIDVLMGHHPDIPMAIDRLGLGGVNYAPDITVYHTSVHIVCHQFDGAEALLDKINVRIREARANGLAQDLLGKHAEIVPLSADEETSSYTN